MEENIRHFYILQFCLPYHAMNFIGPDKAILMIYGQNINPKNLYKFILDNKIEINYV